MHGPRAASIPVAPSARMAPAAASITPASSPRQPACTSPTTPSGLAMATGAQSAVNTASATPGTPVTRASPAWPCTPPGAPTTWTEAPWTWRNHAQAPAWMARRRASPAAPAPGPTSPSLRPVQWRRAPLLEERRDVEIIVLPLEVGELVVAQAEVTRPPRRRRLRLVPAVEAGGDHRDAHLVAHRLVDHVAE